MDFEAEQRREMSKILFFLKKVNGKVDNLKERMKECEVRFFSDVD